jgi:hypothetical protein
MGIADIILREYYIGCTPYELFQRMSWFEILSLLYTKKNRNKDNNRQTKEDTKIENGKRIKIIRKPVAYFRRKGF